MPHRRGTAGQYHSAGGDGETDLVGGQVTADILGQQGAQHILHHRGRQAGGVGIDQEEQGVVGQQLDALRHQRIHLLLQLPHLAAGSATVGGRIHQDAVVGVAAALFTLDELDAVVHQPAHGLKPEEVAFSLPQATMPLEASTWVT